MEWLSEGLWWPEYNQPLRDTPEARAIFFVKALISAHHSVHPPDAKSNTTKGVFGRRNWPFGQGSLEFAPVTESPRHRREVEIGCPLPTEKSA
jgi:hypothetical protein